MCVVVSDEALRAVFVGEQFLAPVAREYINYPGFLEKGRNQSNWKL